MKGVPTAVAVQQLVCKIVTKTVLLGAVVQSVERNLLALVQRTVVSVVSPKVALQCVVRHAQPNVVLV